MADPLTLLREYHSSKKEITEKDGKFIFDEATWPKDVKTNYIISGSGKDGSSKEYYTLECLLFLLKNVKLNHPVYVRLAAKEKIPAVKQPDRKDVLDYIRGLISTSANIDNSAKNSSASNEIPVTVKREAIDEPLVSAVSTIKKPRKEENELQKVKVEADSDCLDNPGDTLVTTSSIKTEED